MVTACDCILGCSPWCLGFLFVGVLGVVVCGLLLVRRCFGLLIWLDLVLPMFGVCGCRWFVGACVGDCLWSAYFDGWFCVGLIVLVYVVLWFVC